MLKGNLKSIPLQLIFITLSAIAVIMLFTCIKQSNENNNEASLSQIPTQNTNQAPLTNTDNATPEIKNQHIKDQYDYLTNTKNNNNSLPQSHIVELNSTLENNLSLQGLEATKKEDGTVVIQSSTRLKTVSVAIIDDYGNIRFEEHNQSISSDSSKVK